ncbi:hypothetical protein BpHYR1_002022 [Brachionus plicatilis]|uniref:Uncharacterized protein n=1 Tax=Brachionus plicatilis TaxID=10195 RepID=A0A3M7RAK1_BRAPC|nr:hypothetical protein BpHYR1_002022 [Brachionus plicatilis]
MKITVEKSCSVVFSRYKKESDNLNLKIYGNRIVSQKEIKFLVSNRLFELSEKYVGTGLSHSIPLVERLIVSKSKIGNENHKTFPQNTILIVGTCQIGQLSQNRRTINKLGATKTLTTLTTGQYHFGVLLVARRNNPIHHRRLGRIVVKRPGTDTLVKRSAEQTGATTGQAGH